MHIILGVLGTLVTILVLLNRLHEGGIDIGWLNPFSWRRRRAFRKAYQLSAAYSLEDPMDAAALLMVAVAKVDGDISTEQKRHILRLFQSEFKLSPSRAQELLGASVHIYGRGDDVIASPEKVLHRSREAFTPEQVTSTLNLINDIANVEGQPSASQRTLVNAIEKCFPTQERGKWH